MIKFSVIAPNATYTLVRNTAGVNEGSSFNITLNTTGVQNGQAIPYTITGIQQADISEPLTGSFVIQNGQANKVFSVVADVLTEGTEVFTMTLDGIGSNISVTVNDTSVSTDPYWNNVSLLMHMDGNATDVKNHNMIDSEVVFSTTKRFGSHSAYFNGTSSYIGQMGSGNDWVFRQGDFTVEGWVNIPAIQNYNYARVISVSDSSFTSGTWMVRCMTSNQLTWSIGFQDWTIGEITPNTWTHFAITRSEDPYTPGISSVLRGFINGVKTMEVPGHGRDYNLSAPLFLGRWNPGGYYFKGYIDEVRITKGVARYVADFTPPTDAFLGA